MQSNNYQQFRLDYLDWKGKKQTIFLYAENIKEARETASHMQGLKAIELITPMD